MEAAVKPLRGSGFFSLTGVGCSVQYVGWLWVGGRSMHWRGDETLWSMLEAMRMRLFMPLFLFTQGLRQDRIGLIRQANAGMVFGAKPFQRLGRARHGCGGF